MFNSFIDRFDEEIYENAVFFLCFGGKWIKYIDEVNWMKICAIEQTKIIVEIFDYEKKEVIKCLLGISEVKELNKKGTKAFEWKFYKIAIMNRQWLCGILFSFS